MVCVDVRTASKHSVFTENGSGTEAGDAPPSRFTVTLYDHVRRIPSSSGCVLDFNVNRMVHINAMVVWMLYGFIGSVYWLVEDESGTQLVGAKLANLNFWILTTAVTVVVLVYLFIQTGPGTKESIWFINEGREYIEAPRWADFGIVVCVLIFFYNVAATFMKGKWSGISGVLVLDLVALAGL